jgi:hypothetical protein
VFTICIFQKINVRQSKHKKRKIDINVKIDREEAREIGEKGGETGSKRERKGERDRE